MLLFLVIILVVTHGYNLLVKKLLRYQICISGPVIIAFYCMPIQFKKMLVNFFINLDFFKKKVWDNPNLKRLFLYYEGSNSTSLLLSKRWSCCRKRKGNRQTAYQTRTLFFFSDQTRQKASFARGEFALSNLMPELISSPIQQWKETPVPRQKRRLLPHASSPIGLGIRLGFFLKKNDSQKTEIEIRI